MPRRWNGRFCGPQVEVALAWIRGEMKGNGGGEGMRAALDGVGFVPLTPRFFAAYETEYEHHC